MPMRKDTVLRISIDEYDAVLPLSKLPELPRQNIRKIFKMLYDPRNRYYEEAQNVPAAIDAWRQASLRAWENASKRYTDGWRLVNKHSRSKESIAVLARNRRLKNNVKRAKARHDRWAALQAIQAEITKGC